MNSNSKIRVENGTAIGQKIRVNFKEKSFCVFLEIDYKLSDESIKVIQDFFVELDKEGFNFYLQRNFFNNILSKIGEFINNEIYDGEEYGILIGGGFDENIADYYFMFCEDIAPETLSYCIAKAIENENDIN